MIIKNIIFVMMLSLGVYTAPEAQEIKLGEKKTVIVHSTVDSTERPVFIQLPKSYGKRSTGYPVVLLFDAQDQSLFNYTSASIDRLMYSNDIPEVIFVGIPQKDRSKELSVEKNEASSLRFLRFVKNDLLGYLNKNYKTNGYYTWIGHSLGGQFVTNAMMAHPETFRSVISISGALNYPAADKTYHRKVLARLRDYLTEKVDGVRTSQKYYFATGDEGFQDSGFKIGAFTVDSMLMVHQPSFLNWRFDNLKGFNHMTTPLMGIPAGLTFIYHDWHFSDSLAMDVLLQHKTDPMVAIQTQQEHILKSYGAPIELPDNAYYQFENYYFEKGDLAKAKLLTDKIINLYPDDEDGYILMADILEKQADPKGAIEYLQVANSKSTSGKYQERISRLSGKLAK